MSDRGCDSAASSRSPASVRRTERVVRVTSVLHRRGSADHRAAGQRPDHQHRLDWCTARGAHSRRLLCHQVCGAHDFRWPTSGKHKDPRDVRQPRRRVKRTSLDDHPRRNDVRDGQIPRHRAAASRYRARRSAGDRSPRQRRHDRNHDPTDCVTPLTARLGKPAIPVASSTMKGTDE